MLSAGNGNFCIRLTHASGYGKNLRPNLQRGIICHGSFLLGLDLGICSVGAERFSIEGLTVSAVSPSPFWRWYMCPKN